MVGAVLDVRDDYRAVETYTTRPKREGERDSYEHRFVSGAEYESLKSASSNWDETIYAGYKYGTDGEKYMRCLQDGMNIIVPIAPDFTIIRGLSAKYGVSPVTVWIDTDQDVARARAKDDAARAARQESTVIRDKFDYIFTPTGDIMTDRVAFVALISEITE